jgi:hypothetical protein
VGLFVSPVTTRGNEVNNNNKHTISNIKRVVAAKLTRLTHKIAIKTAPRGRELYNLQFSLQAASPETFGYTLVSIRLF